MNYILENDELRIVITSLGAELQSVYGKKTGFEYLWQGDETYWKNRSTVLFPICGRLFEGKYTYEGKEYEMCLHGFAKLTEFTAVSVTNKVISLTMVSSEETKKCYPFDFAFTVTYTLDGNTVRVAYAVENRGEGDLPFSVGGHPGFNVPFCKGEDFSDYYLEFSEKKHVEQMVMTENKFFSGRKVPYQLEDDKILRLSHDLFDNDAVFLDGSPKQVSLKSVKNSRAVTVSFPEMRHVGFWHKPCTQAPYVCIEPWQGFPSTDGEIDDFRIKNEMMHLEKGKRYDVYFEITIKE